MNRPSERASVARRSAKLPSVGALLALALVGAMAALLGYRLGAERDRSAALQSQVGRLEAEKSALLAHFERQSAPLREGSGLGARTPDAPTPEASGTSAWNAVPGGFAPPSGAVPGPTALPTARAADRTSAWRDPAIRDAMQRQQSAAMHRMYPDLAEALGLSREDADRFIEMQVEQQMRKTDASLLLTDPTGAPGRVEREEVARQMSAARRDADQELTAQFGPDILQAWSTYQQGLSARMELRGLQLELIDAGMALTPGQREALVAALVREQQIGWPAGSKKLTTEARSEQADASYERLQNAARLALNAEQFARFDVRQRQRLQILKAAGEGARTRSASP